MSQPPANEPIHCATEKPAVPSSALGHSEMAFIGYASSIGALCAYWYVIIYPPLVWDSKHELYESFWKGHPIAWFATFCVILGAFIGCARMGAASFRRSLRPKVEWATARKDEEGHASVGVSLWVIGSIVCYFALSPDHEAIKDLYNVNGRGPALNYPSPLLAIVVDLLLSAAGNGLWIFEIDQAKKRAAHAQQEEDTKKYREQRAREVERRIKERAEHVQATIRWFQQPERKMEEHEWLSRLIKQLEKIDSECWQLEKYRKQKQVLEEENLAKANALKAKEAERLAKEADDEAKKAEARREIENRPEVSASAQREAMSLYAAHIDLLRTPMPLPEFRVLLEKHLGVHHDSLTISDNLNLVSDKVHKMVLREDIRREYALCQPIIVGEYSEDAFEEDLERLLRDAVSLSEYESAAAVLRNIVRKRDIVESRVWVKKGKRRRILLFS